MRKSNTGNHMNVKVIHMNSAAEIVAEFDVTHLNSVEEILEYAWAKTQNAAENWHANGKRSTDLGDIMLLNNKSLYKVGICEFNHVGFVK